MQRTNVYISISSGLAAAAAYYRIGESPRDFLRLVGLEITLSRIISVNKKLAARIVSSRCRYIIHGEKFISKLYFFL